MAPQNRIWAGRVEAVGTGTGKVWNCHTVGVAGGLGRYCDTDSCATELVLVLASWCDCLCQRRRIERGADLQMEREFMV